jgi:NADH-quinone oxidoreductase subunit A
LYGDYFDIAFFFVAGVLLVLLIYLLNWFFAPRTKPTARQNTPYECGDEPVGTGWLNYDVRFYPFALLFVVFDVEVIFLFAWVAAFKSLGLFGLIEVVVFIGILVVGLLYAWKKGALKWV